MRNLHTHTHTHTHTIAHTSGASTEEAAAARQLQEELSAHLDAVEHVLMREIQARSHAFYKALDTLQDLYQQVDDTLQTILHLRSVMQVLLPCCLFNLPWPLMRLFSLMTRLLSHLIISF